MQTVVNGGCDLSSIRKELEDARGRVKMLSDAYEGIQMRMIAATEIAEICQLTDSRRDTRAKLHKALIDHTTLDMRRHKLVCREPKPVGFSESKSCDLSFFTIWADKEQQVQLLMIGTGAIGRPWHRIELFLQSVCGPFEMTNYRIWDFGEKTEIECVSELPVLPGNYAFIPTTEDIMPLRVVHEPFPLYPTDFPGFYDTGRFEVYPNREETIRVVDACFQGIETNLLLKGRLMQRDSTRLIRQSVECSKCRIFPSEVCLRVSYILGRCWWRNVGNRRRALPGAISDVINGFENTIDDVKNGLLLCSRLACYFDEGRIAFQYINEHLQIVAITRECEHIDGHLILTHWRGGWSENNKPHEQLLAFHLRNSVFKHMRRFDYPFSSSPTKIYGTFRDDEPMEVQAAQRQVEDLFDYEPIGERLAKNITLDTLADAEFGGY